MIDLNWDSRVNDSLVITQHVLKMNMVFVHFDIVHFSRTELIDLPQLMLSICLFYVLSGGYLLWF